jgi:hypothetical protein
MELQATAGEEKILEVLKQSVTVTATREECFKVASDLDSYTEWCRKGGMKKVMVMERDEQNRASKVQVYACYHATTAKCKNAEFFMHF